LATSTVTQQQSISYSGSPQLLQYYLTQLAGDVERIEIGDKMIFRMFKQINVILELRMVVIEWIANPVNDMYADAVLAVVLKAESEAVLRKSSKNLHVLLGFQNDNFLKKLLV
jgi:cleavage and polyadenylation specificity factor subunit 3